MDPAGTRQLSLSRCPILQRHLCNPHWPQGVQTSPCWACRRHSAQVFPVLWLGLGLSVFFSLGSDGVGLPALFKSQKDKVLKAARSAWGPKGLSLLCHVTVHSSHSWVPINIRILNSVLNWRCSPGLLVSGSQLYSYLCVTLGRLSNLCACASVHRDIPGMGRAI